MEHEIHIGTDPFEVLPLHLIQDLEAFAFEDLQWEAQDARIETLLYLCEVWSNIAFDEGAVARVCDRSNIGDYILDQREDGVLVPLTKESGNDSVYVIPAKLFETLKLEILAKSLNQRIDRIENLTTLIKDWQEILLDLEKLVGHLLIAHEYSTRRNDIEMDSLRKIHAAAHRKKTSL